MYTYRYLIIGGGMAGDSAMREIRANDPEGSIGLIGMEGARPYDRPPLSKKLWSGKPIDSVWRPTPAGDTTFHLGRRATSVDRHEKSVVDDLGQRYRYEKLLIATGGSPRTLPFEAPGVIYFRTLRDYWQLRSVAAPGRKIAVIGGGFIGSELAAALAGVGCRVTMIFPESCIGARSFTSDLGAFLNGYYREKGVDVRSGHVLEGLALRAGRYRLSMKRTEGRPKAETLEADAVVAGIGITPNTELAQKAGLSVADGILVDEGLHASDADIFAAGDVARFVSTALDKRVRVEHEDSANTMGAAAGAAMSGKAVTYAHQPYFYSDLFDLGYEAVGELDPVLTTVADWREPYRKGVVYYLREERVVGVLLWNVWDRVPAARELIAAKRPVAAGELIGRIPAA